MRTSYGKVTQLPSKVFSNQKTLRMVRRALKRSLLILQRRIRENLSGRYLSVRSGRLRGGISNKVDIGAGRARGLILTNSKYAHIHDRGGLIFPKTASNLAIPFKGVQGSPEDYSDTFVAKDIIWLRLQTKRSPIKGLRPTRGLIPLFSLKPYVTIPKRSFVAPAVRATEAKVRSIILATLEKINK